MRVADGIFRVDGVRVGNAYVVASADGLLVVDTGIRGSAKRIVALARGLGRRATDIRYIVLTHADLDHAGSAAALKALTHAALAVHELEAPVVAGAQPPKGGRRMAALYRLLRFRPVQADLLLKEGDTIAGFRVMHVPGHTAGSIALYRDDGVVFSGDTLLSDKRGSVRPPDPRLALDPAQTLASAERIKGLPMTLLLPGHGAPVRFERRLPSEGG